MRCWCGKERQHEGKCAPTYYDELDGLFVKWDSGSGEIWKAGYGEEFKRVWPQ